jgi:RNA polymerase sigma factor (sigma-70 family)
MDSWELEQVARQYGDAIYRVALQATRHPWDAEDVLQEVLLERYRTQQSFTSPEHERRWLLRVAVNKSWNVRRTRRRRDALPLEQAPQLAAPPADPACRELYDAVRALPPNQRVTVDLYYYEGYSTDEIAGVMGVPPATVRTWLRRARLRLKKELKEAWEDDES